MGGSRILSERGLTHLSIGSQWLQNNEHSCLEPYLTTIFIISSINWFVFSLIHDMLTEWCKGINNFLPTYEQIWSQSSVFLCQNITHNGEPYSMPVSFENNVHKLIWNSEKYAHQVKWMYLSLQLCYFICCWPNHLTFTSWVKGYFQKPFTWWSWCCGTVDSIWTQVSHHVMGTNEWCISELTESPNAFHKTRGLWV